jgi:hypothetical protein
LEESVVDLMARRWELSLGGRQDAQLSELADMEERFLLRYTKEDKEKVEQYLKTIMKSERKLV